MSRNRRGQIDPPLDNEEIDDDIKEEDEIPVNIDFFDNPENENEDYTQEGFPLLDPLQPEPCSTLSHGNVTLVKITFQNKTEFTLEMQKEVALVVQECVHGLKMDPREYHPFYLTVQKWLDIGKKLDYIPNSRVDLVWGKCDALAVSEFENSKASPAKKIDKPYSFYLQCILNFNSKNKEKYLSRNTRMVERAWKKMLEEGTLSSEDIRGNVKARLDFFQHSKTLISLEDCVQMNSLWSRLLSSKLFHQLTPPSFSVTTEKQVKQSRVYTSDTKNTPERQPPTTTLSAEERKALYKERLRLKRQQETPEERENRRKLANETDRRRRRLESDERRRKRCEERMLAKAKRLEKMTEEERQQHRNKLAGYTRQQRFRKLSQEDQQAYMEKMPTATAMRQTRAKLLEKMTPEEKEKLQQRRKKKAEYARQRRSKLSQAFRDKMAQAARQRKTQLLETMTPEEKQVLRDKWAESKGQNQDKHTQINANTRRIYYEETEEEKEKMQKVRDLQKQLKLEEISLQEKVELKLELVPQSLDLSPLKTGIPTLKRKETIVLREVIDTKPSEAQPSTSLSNRRALYNERKRLKRLQETPEEREKRCKLRSEKNRERASLMNPGELQAWKARIAKNSGTWRAKKFKDMTEEKLWGRERKSSDKLLQGWANTGRIYYDETEEEKKKMQKVRNLQKQLKREEISLQERVEIRVKIKELSKDRRARLKEVRKKFLDGLPEEDRWRYGMTRYLEGHAKRARIGKSRYSSKSPDLKAYVNLRHKMWKESLTGEKKQRHNETVLKSIKKYMAKEMQDPVKKAKWNKKILEYQRRRVKNESEEERQKRLIRIKVNSAKRKLKKEMEDEGDFTQEEFEKRLEEIVENIKAQPVKSISAYKPRPRKATKKTVQLKPDICEDKVEPEEIARAPILVPEPALIAVSLNFVSDEREFVQKEHSITEVECTAEVNCDFEIDLEPNLESGNDDDAMDYPCSPLMEFEAEEIKDVKGNEEAPALKQNIASLSSQPGVSVEPNIEVVSNSIEDKKEAEDEPQMMCQHCPEKFSDDEHLRAHIRAKHSIKCWTCPMCQKVILSPAELVEHFQTEHKEEDEGDKKTAGKT